MQADARLADGAVVPGQAALIWELRPDLQSAFPLDHPEQVAAYLAWVLGDGCVDGSIDPSLFTATFLDWLDGPVAQQGKWPVPPTEGLLLARRLGHFRDVLPDGLHALSTDEGRLAYTLWFAFIAPDRLGWPAALGRGTRACLQQPTLYEAYGRRLSLAAVAVLRARDDLRRTFDLDTVAGRRGGLRWLVFEGVAQLGCALEGFDPGLAAWLECPIEPDGQTNRAALANEGLPKLAAAAASPSPLPPPPATPPVEGSRSTAPAHTHASAETRRTPLLLSGVWGAPSGRAEDLRSTAAALKAAGWAEFVIFDLAEGRLLSADGEPLAPAPVHAGVNLVHDNADAAVWNWRTFRSHQISADRTVGWWAWELEALPSWWRAAFAFYDEVWAATAFTQRALEASADRPVRRAPMAVVLSTAPADGGRALAGVSSEATLFLFAFDFRSYPARKNPEAVIDAFRAAFPGGDEEVALVIKIQGEAAAPESAEALTRRAGPDTRIRLLDAVLGRPELMALFAEADAFVSLHRSEGFGRAPAEAMALGRPVIVTAYSGNLDFTRPDTALLVDFSLVPVEPDQYVGVEGQRWADPDVSEATAWMRRVHAHDPDVARRAAAGQALIRFAYAPERVGRELIQLLSGLNAQIGRSDRPRADDGHPKRVDGIIRSVS